MGGDCQRTGSGGAHGGDHGESVRNVVRVERTDHERDAGILPDSGTDGGDRVRAPAAWGRPDDAHPYDLPGSHERLREEVSGALSTVTMRRMGVSVLLALSLIGGTAAHRLDEYLQATLIGVTRDGTDVEIQLTPGVAMLPVLMAVIDQDRDGRISSGEERAYVGRVAREVELRVDGVPAPLSLIESKFPTIEAMREGLGTIRMKLRTARRGHELRFENRHLPQVSAYLVNCLAAPSDGLVVRRQERDEAQRSIEFEYSFGGGAGSGPRKAWIALGAFLAGAIRVVPGARAAGPIYRAKNHQRTSQTSRA